MNPETAADRLNLLLDFGEEIIAEPAGGGPAFPFVALFNQGPRRVTELDLSEIAPVEVVGEDTWLLARAEDVAQLDQFAALTIPSAPGIWRVHTIDRDDLDGALRQIQIVEGG